MGKIKSLVRCLIALCYSFAAETGWTNEKEFFIYLSSLARATIMEVLQSPLLLRFAPPLPSFSFPEADVYAKLSPPRFPLFSVFLPPFPVLRLMVHLSFCE